MNVRRLAVSTLLAILAMLVSSFGMVIGIRAESLYAAFWELGPTRAAVACAFGGTYRYDPRVTVADDHLISERPEAAVVAFVGQTQVATDGRLARVTVSRVEVDPGQGQATVWADVYTRSSPDREERFVLQADRSQWISVDLPARTTYVCQKNLGKWRVIALRGSG